MQTSIDELTPKEAEVLSLYNQGYPRKIAAPMLSISENTYAWHLRQIRAKSNARTRQDMLDLGDSLTAQPKKQTGKSRKQQWIEQLCSNPVIEHHPGIFAVMDLDSSFLYSNAKTLKWTGYKSLDKQIKTTYADMKCKASERHAEFSKQDEIARKRTESLKIFGLFCYADDDWKLLLGEKYAVRNTSGEVIATASLFNDVTRCNIAGKFLNLLTDSTKTQHSFHLEKDYPDLSLSKRQSECLFYLIRGHTVYEVASILNIRPRTVEYHVDEIKNKMCVQTKSQLIEKAFAKGYVDIIPEHIVC